MRTNYVTLNLQNWNKNLENNHFCHFSTASGTKFVPIS